MDRLNALLSFRHRRRHGDRHVLVFKASSRILLLCDTLLHDVFEFVVVVGRGNFLVTAFALSVVKFVDVSYHQLD